MTLINANLQRLFDSKRQIILSASTDIFTNLAFEDYIYTNKKVKDQFLLIYINSPSVIIGRFQNTWKETNPVYLKHNNIKLARRKSGGGAVYHDEGNINLSFFSDRKQYNRKNNLNFITKVLANQGINAHINEKDDITIDNRKISGTAAKLGQFSCYHHCTLLVESNLAHINKGLKSVLETHILDCKGTPSKKSNLINIKDIHSTTSLQKIIRCFIQSYFDGTYDKENVNFMDPTEQDFPGLNKLIHELKSWDWIYGKSPKFSLNLIHDNNQTPHLLGSQFGIAIDQGCIQNITLTPNHSSKSLKIDMDKYKLCFTLSNLTGPIVYEKVACSWNKEYAELFKNLVMETLSDKLL